MTTIENEEKNKFVWVLCFITHVDDIDDCVANQSIVSYLNVFKTEEEAIVSRKEESIKRLTKYLTNDFFQIYDITKNQQKYLKNKSISEPIFKDKYIQTIQDIWKLEKEFYIFEYIPKAHNSYIYKREL